MHITASRMHGGRLQTWWLLTTLTLLRVVPGMMGSQILHSKEKKLGAFNNTNLHSTRD